MVLCFIVCCKSRLYTFENNTGIDMTGGKFDHLVAIDYNFNGMVFPSSVFPSRGRLKLKITIIVNGGEAISICLHLCLTRD